MCLKTLSLLMSHFNTGTVSLVLQNNVAFEFKHVVILMGFIVM